MDIFAPQLAKVVDPELDISQKKIYPILKGAPLFNPKTFTPQSDSDYFTHFNCTPPSPTTFVSRKIIIRCRITATLTCGLTNSTSSLLSTNVPWRIATLNQFGVQSMPIHRHMRTCEILLNGQSLSINPEEILIPLGYYRNPKNNKNSHTADKMDQVELGSVRASGIGNIRMRHADGLHQWFPNSRDEYGGRMDKVQIITWTNDQTTANTITGVVVFELMEELQIPPCLSMNESGDAFIGIQKLDVNITWRNNIEDMFQIYSYARINGIEPGVANPTFVAKSLRFFYKEAPMNMSIPPYIQYPYNEYRLYSNRIAGAVDNDVQTVISNSIQLNCIPRYLYVYVRQPINVRESVAIATYDAANAGTTHPCFAQSDQFASIHKVEVSWNNETCLLGDLDREDLWALSVKNGYAYSKKVWAGQVLDPGGMTGVVDAGALRSFNGVGSILCIEFGTDIGLKEYEAPGLIGTYNLQVRLTINVGGNSPHIANGDLCLLTVLPGILAVYNNSCSKRVGVVDVKDVTSAGMMTGIDWFQVQKKHLYGGAKFKSLVKRARKYGKALGRALEPAVKQALNAKGLGDLGPAYDFVVGKRKNKRRRVDGGSMVAGRRRKKKSKKKQVGGSMVAGRRRKKKSKKKGKKGGAMISKNELNQLLNEI